ncbi:MULTISPECIES: TolC family protein [Sphingomonas]|uniref:Multidrug transporter n=1 Tax=Sphingomonas hankookensis TaxID=563996 RepID=A0ABR5Y849_9SPHN|nr:MULTISPECIES: TolC family protein [Sphingomonas]KZE08660.1 multidrug transporter [Sphingomonas hankookensis]PZT91537.1 MAG: TolC family protein [Sphingomonas sp.]RSV24459.1 TolC family protein [Sphingomonas sp. ABOLH]WCP74023.1 TolC family protein [Sphingomonas hankookensis]
MIRAALALALLAPVPALAQPAAAPLTLDEVLRSSARAAPQIIEALAKIRSAEGRALTAEGAFDTVFEAEGKSRALGYYDGTVVSGRATRPMGDNGGYLYGNYRVTRGDFPVYEDEFYTNRLGEVKVGALYSLMRDRLVDERRTRRTLAGGDIDIARFEREATAIGVQRRAVDAYQNWVAAGQRLRAYRDLLDLSERRRGGIARQIELGARPDILLTENDQNLVRRRGLVVKAEGDFQAAANALSLYYRDAAGNPLLVGAERLPGDSNALVGPRVVAPVGDVAQRRPDLQVLLTRVDQGLAKLALAENDLRPRLDLRGEVGKDIGPPGLGGSSRTPLEAAVGFRFSIPLQNRAARGKVSEAEAEIDALNARGRFVRDQIAVEVEGILIGVGAAERLAAVAEQERALAERLADAERRRFELGSSDFFLVNQREETANDARVRLIDAQARIAAARAELAAATADRVALGLE